MTRIETARGASQRRVSGSSKSARPDHSFANLPNEASRREERTADPRSIAPFHGASASSAMVTISSAMASQRSCGRRAGAHSARGALPQSARNENPASVRPLVKALAPRTPAIFPASGLPSSVRVPAVAATGKRNACDPALELFPAHARITQKESPEPSVGESLQRIA